jgi:hypothetical protein
VTRKANSRKEVRDRKGSLALNVRRQNEWLQQTAAFADTLEECDLASHKELSNAT